LKAAKLWARDENVHVRRLASEGSRPRLPWGIRLQRFVEDPGPILPLLETLRDDPSEYVRRSVANNLNDIAKDHADVVVRVARSWLKGAAIPQQRLVRHACRSLIKDGHAGALAIFGVHPANLQDCDLKIDAKKISLGDTLGMTLELQGGPKSQKLVIDYVMHYLRANGSLSEKVFKWTELEIGPNERKHIGKKHAYRKVTTRKDYPGTQAISVRINGKDFSRVEFELSV
jgi:3-methyladenine DNA glycosylase AlkC